MTLQIKRIYDPAKWKITPGKSSRVKWGIGVILLIKKAPLKESERSWV